MRGPLYPWEPDCATRQVLCCATCGFTSPWWVGADDHRFCVSCEQAERERGFAPLRVLIAADIITTARMSGICIGKLELIHETEKARLYEWPDGDTAWIPKSCIVAVDDDGIYVKAWFCIKEMPPRLAAAAA